MSHALLHKPASLLHAVKDTVLGSAPLTEEDDRQAAEAFERSRGYDLSRAERAKLAWELAEGAPVVLPTRTARRAGRGD